jgi:hypothetical protein
MKAHLISGQKSSQEDIPINDMIFETNILKEIQKNSNKQNKKNIAQAISDAIKTLKIKKKQNNLEFPELQKYLEGQVINYNYIHKKNII